MDKTDKWQGPERRGQQRAGGELAAQIVNEESGNQPMVVKATNISCSGVNCRLNTCVEPFQTLHLCLIIPHFGDDGRIHNALIQLQGVVVRCDLIKDGSKEYQAALFFNDISPRQKDMIIKYVEQQEQMSEESTELKKPSKKKKKAKK